MGGSGDLRSRWRYYDQWFIYCQEHLPTTIGFPHPAHILNR
jgi:hypothetical protein